MEIKIGKIFYLWARLGGFGGYNITLHILNLKRFYHFKNL